jgi:hypothetical protein
MGAAAEHRIQSPRCGIGIQRNPPTMVWLDRSTARKAANSPDIGAIGRIGDIGSCTNHEHQRESSRCIAVSRKKKIAQILTKKRRKMIKLSSKRLVSKRFAVDAKAETIDKTMRKYQDNDPLAMASRVNRVEISPFVFSRIVAKIDARREAMSVQGFDAGAQRVNSNSTVPLAWTFVAVFLLLLEVIAFSGVSPSIHDPEADTVNLLGDFVNQTEQLYVYEN